jgi:hypothetical protein
MIPIAARIIVSLYIVVCRPERLLRRWQVAELIIIPQGDRRRGLYSFNGFTAVTGTRARRSTCQIGHDDTVSAGVHAWPRHQRNRTMRVPRGARWLGLALVAAAAAQLPAGAAELNDYPTAARADYVFACMKTNADTRPALEKCSCSIDVIASILPYDRYVAAETFLSLSQVPGRFGTMFQSPEQARAAINELRRAQAEGEVRCF